MSEIQLIGIGDEGAQGLQSHVRERIAACDLLVGGERHLAFFPDFAGETYVITGKLTELVLRLQEEQRKGRRVVVLASGDPLFFGIGSYLATKIDGLIISPALSSIQMAFAKVGLGWQDALLTSLHGKSIKGLAQRIDGQAKVALLTDHINTPAAIAAYLRSFGFTEYRMYVAENLGSEQEKGAWFELEDVAENRFSALNLVLLVRKPEAYVQMYALGIEDDAFLQRKPDKGLITKREVRVLSLSELQLRPDSVVWDIGTCTGSVAIEAAKIAPFGHVYAIEKNEVDLENARQNAQTFRTDITFVHGRAPEGLDGWPDPDAVFIGGSGGEMGEVLRIAAERLRPEGRIVLNAATIETLYGATTTCAQLGLQTRVTLVQVARSKPILQMTRFEGLNPIYIITAWKQTEEEFV